MTHDKERLRAAAEAALAPGTDWWQRDRNFTGLANAKTVLALLSENAALAAENERLRKPALLAEKHTGMRVDYSGLLGQCQRALRSREPANAEMLRQLQGHLQELGRRWYAGDTAVVDEILQLYCIERDARAALADKGGAPS